MSFPAQAQKTSHRHGLYTKKRKSPRSLPPIVRRPHARQPTPLPLPFAVGDGDWGHPPCGSRLCSNLHQVWERLPRHRHLAWLSPSDAAGNGAPPTLAVVPPPLPSPLPLRRRRSGPPGMAAAGPSSRLVEWRHGMMRAGGRRLARATWGSTRPPGRDCDGASQRPG